jgi:hypothetical protein
MANEISCSLKVAITPKGTSSTVGNITWQENLIAGCVGCQATIGFTSAAAISLPSGITDPAVLYIQNNDPTNFVTVDAVTGLSAWPQKILPGTAVVLRPANTTLFAKADTAPVNVWIVAG